MFPMRMRYFCEMHVQGTVAEVGSGLPRQEQPATSASPHFQWTFAGH